MEPQTIVAASATAELAEVGAEWSSMQMEPPAVRGAWTHDVEALCRALEAQQRAHFRKADAGEK